MQLLAPSQRPSQPMPNCQRRRLEFHHDKHLAHALTTSALLADAERTLRSSLPEPVSPPLLQHDRRYLHARRHPCLPLHLHLRPLASPRPLRLHPLPLRLPRHLLLHRQLHRQHPPHRHRLLQPLPPPHPPELVLRCFHLLLHQPHFPRVRLASPRLQLRPLPGLPLLQVQHLPLLLRPLAPLAFVLHRGCHCHPVPLGLQAGAHHHQHRHRHHHHHQHPHHHRPNLHLDLRLASRAR
mmetsp:Transcript_2546/g.6059  ORF Transcript_2546/g.6059 Transcript_2546/m.6059 type:complete len:238 (-) Transcript_2546:365-1078(-)